MKIKSKILDFIKRNKLIVILILIPIFFSVFLRIQINNLSLIDALSKEQIENYGKNKFLQQISQENPTLPDSLKIKLAENKFKEFKITNKNQINELISEKSNYFKSLFKDSSGQIYLTAIDPYYYARHARNILENGHIGDELRDGRPYNNHQLAPLGRFSEPNLHMWVEVYAYKLINLFNPGIPLTTVIFYLPIFFSAMSVIPAFFIGKKLQGLAAGFFSALLVAIHPVIVGRTYGGFADTDMYNLLLPLLFILTFIYFLEQIKFQKIFFAVSLMGLLFCAYSTLWSGWGYLLILFTVSLVLTAIHDIFVRHILKRECASFQSLKKQFLLFLLVISSAFIGLLIGRRLLLGSFFMKKTIASLIWSIPNFIFVKSQTLGFELLWPNVLSTVRELETLYFSNIIVHLGGYFLVCLFIVGFIVLLVKLYNLRKITLFFFFLLWALALTYSLTKGIRFIFMFGVLFCLILGYSFAEIINYLNKLILSRSKIPKNMPYLALSGLFTAYIFLGIPFVSDSLFLKSWDEVKHDIPMIDDSWWSTLEYIKNNTQETAIITSWWDFGHWFKFIADRPVTFDGASQNTPQSYWVSRFFATPDEQEALGILRMLDCSANTAFDNLFNWTGHNFLKSIDMLNQALPLAEKEAKTIYQKELTEEQTDKLLSLTHCAPPEAIVIASGDMVGKSVNWGKFGSWNFTRAFLSRKTGKSKPQFMEIAKSVGISSDPAEELFIWLNSHSKEKVQEWVAQTPIFNWEQALPCEETNKIIRCFTLLERHPVEISKQDHSVRIIAGNTISVPKEIIYNDNDAVILKKLPDPSLDYSLILINSNGKYKLQMHEGNIVNSMFVRLFYFDGLGLNHFKLVRESKRGDDSDIKVFKAAWPSETN